jgi:hypothetical protein
LRLLAQVTACFGLVHALTAFYQSTILFGAQKLMIPFYLYDICLHVGCALQLFFLPGRLEYLLTCMCVLHTYVWVRMCYFFCLRYKIGSKYRYSICVTLAG